MNPPLIKNGVLCDFIWNNDTEPERSRVPCLKPCIQDGVPP